MGTTLEGLCLEDGIEALHEMEETLPVHGSLYGLSYCFPELQTIQKSERIKLMFFIKTRIQFLPFFDRLIYFRTVNTGDGIILPSLKKGRARALLCF